MNSFPKPFILFFVFLSFLGIFIFTFFFYFTKIETIELKISPTFKERHFTEDIKNKIILRLKTYEGKKIWRVDLDDLIFEVQKIYPGLKIRIKRKIPNHLSIFLENKDVAVLLLQNGGMLYPVSFQGELQNRLSVNESLDLPLLRGEAFQKSQTLRREAIQLLSQIPPKGLFTLNNISEVIYNEKKSSFLFVLMSNDFILESQKELSPKRIKNINFVLNYLVQKGIKRSRVDARFDKKIIVNKRDSL